MISLYIIIVFAATHHGQWCISSEGVSADDMVAIMSEEDSPLWMHNGTTNLLDYAGFADKIESVDAAGGTAMWVACTDEMNAQTLEITVLTVAEYNDVQCVSSALCQTRPNRPGFKVDCGGMDKDSLNCAINHSTGEG